MGTRRAVAANNVDNAFRQASLAANFSEGQGGEGREFRWLQNNRVACRQRGRNFPGQHEQRKVPRNDLATYAQGSVTFKFGSHQFGPARMVIEMAGDKGNINITAFADRLAVIHAFENREKTFAFLDQSGNGVEMAGTLMAG